MTRQINAMIVGVEKAGTTSLLRYLSEHPEITSHEVMEMPYFVNDAIYRNGWDQSFKDYFGLNTNRKIILAKSVGCMYWNHVPERLYQHNSDLKLIAVLRNPVDRAYSAYWYALQMGREDKMTFEEAILAENERLKTNSDYHLRYHAYLHRGLYGYQINQLLKFFTPTQIKIIAYEEFKEKPTDTVNALFDFLGLDSVKVNTLVRHNETSTEKNQIISWLERQNPIIRKEISTFLPINLKNKIKSLLEKTNHKQSQKIPPIDERFKLQLINFFEDDNLLLQEISKKFI
ncbi:MAG: sulfotransferase [Nitrosomonas sp.]|nr:sulfotransferase [Nitrosomonas sp.]